MLRQRCPHCQRESARDAMDGGVAVCDCREGLQADLHGRGFDTPNTPLPRVPAEHPTRRARPARVATPANRGPAKEKANLLQGGVAEHPYRTKHEPAPKPKGQPAFAIEGYEVKECRGKGGMGQVYRALQKSLGREVAIKTLDLNLARHQASIMRFTKEAAAMAHLRHPNIVQVIDRGSTRERHYFVMEFVDGPSLRELLREGAFAPPEALQIMLQLARTMAYAHKQGVIHRDLKPENILYTGDGVLKVADFGLAGVAHETTYIRKLTRSFVSMGTECYMAPEQRRDAKNVDFGADLYSMGVIFYELLTNQLPFPQVPPPGAVIAAGYPNIDDIIRTCLQPDPAQRFNSTDAMVHQLEQALEQSQGAASAPAGPSDTVVDTPGVPLAQIAQDANANEDSHALFESRLSGWSGRVRSAISDAGDHVSVSWQAGNLRKLLVSGASLAGVAALVGFCFWLLPSPPAHKTTPKEEAQKAWKVPADVQVLANKQTKLGFDFKSAAAMKKTWGTRLRPQWKRDRFWSIIGQQITQNTYYDGFIRTPRLKWALYNGHTFASKSLVIETDLKLLAPIVTKKGQVIRSVPAEMRRLGYRTTHRHPRIGFGLRGDKGRKITLVLQQRGNLFSYSLKEHYGRKLIPRQEKGQLPEPLRYGRSAHVQLTVTATTITAHFNGKQLASIQRRPHTTWSAHPGLLCRDAHCVFERVHFTGNATRNTKK